MKVDYFGEPIIYKVSQITSKIKELLETDPELMDVVVEGEISNWKIRGGHAYFVLKDEEAVLNCVMFGAIHRARNIEDGFHVLAYGKIGVYEKRGQYQLYCEQIQVVSKVGLLYQKYEELKKKLREEGVFDKPKKIIPTFPKRIGVITSRDSAAYRDIYKIISKRYPLVEIYLFHTSVQGKEALVEIPRALKIADEYSLDLLILARGGGSIEDLWAFNEEVVVKSAFNLKTPLITGVGHEIDTTLVDFVADLRAPTPTGAASAAVPDIEELKHRLNLLLKNGISKLTDKLRRLDDLIKRDYRILVRNSPRQILLKKSDELERAFNDLLKAFESKVENLSHKTLRYSEILRRIGLHQKIEMYSENLKNKIKQLYRFESSTIVDSEKQLESILKNLKALKPTKPLERGFAIVRKSGKIVNASKLSEGDNITIEFIDGKAKSTVQKVIMQNDMQQNDQV